MDGNPILMDRQTSLLMQLLPIDTYRIDLAFVLLINATWQILDQHMDLFDTMNLLMLHLYVLVMLMTLDCCSLDWLLYHFDKQKVDKDNPNKSVLDLKNMMLLHPNRMDMEHLSMGNDWQMYSDIMMYQTMIIEVFSSFHYCLDMLNIHHRRMERRDHNWWMLELELKVNSVNHRDVQLMNWLGEELIEQWL